MTRPFSDVASVNLPRACALPDTPPSAVLACEDRRNLHVGVFFDGTDNDKDRDKPKGEHTNVARLWQLYVNRSGTDTIRAKLYLPGVGSGTDAKVAAELEEYKSPTDKSSATHWGKLLGSLPGKAAGTGAKDRLNAAYAWVQAQCQRVSADKEKRVDVYGFSRGAAIARTFVNLVNGALKGSAENLEVRFVGIFDTVESFGKEGALINCYLAPGDAQQIVHFTAMHEHRSHFPLTTGPNDTAYVGVHSDVGGGYPPLDKDNKANHIAFIPLADMHEASRNEGVQMDNLSRLNELSDNDIEQVRKEVQEFKQPVLSEPGTTPKKPFVDKYIHDSTSLAPWNWSTWHYQREEIIPEKKALSKGKEPPDFSWDESQAAAAGGAS